MDLSCKDKVRRLLVEHGYADAGSVIIKDRGRRTIPRTSFINAFTPQNHRIPQRHRGVYRRAFSVFLWRFCVFVVKMPICETASKHFWVAPYNQPILDFFIRSARDGRQGELR